jgi:hypothetical protein
MKRSKQMRLTFNREVVIPGAKSEEHELVQALAELLLAAAGRDQRRANDESEADR